MVPSYTCHDQSSPEPAAGLQKLDLAVAEPPELSGPHAPIIVSNTSDRCARVPNESRSLSGVLRKPKSSTLHSFQEFPH